MDAQTQARLQNALRRESRSVMAYTAEAFPWTTAGGLAAVERLRKRIAAEQEAVTALGRFLVRQRIPLPYPRSYPAGFTTINFIALDWLVPRLVAFEKESLADLDDDLAHVKDPAARAVLEKLHAVKKDNLAALEILQGGHASAPGAS